MSARQLRKFQKKELEAKDGPVPQRADEEEEEESDGSPVRPAPRPSLFATLAALGDEGEGDDDEKDEDEEGETVMAAPTAAAAAAAADMPSGKAKKPKKKKKKGKKPAAAPAAGPAAPLSKDVTADDDIDRALQELELAGKASGSGASGGGARDQGEAARDREYARMCALLRISSQHLKVMNEMRSVFGREVVDAGMADDEAVGVGASNANPAARRAARRRGGAQQVNLEQFLKFTPVPGSGLKPFSESSIRRNALVQGKETWPNDTAAGLSMKVVKDVDEPLPLGIQEFSFAHDKSYDQLETQFYGLVDSLDSMNMVYFLKGHPYHVKTLFQVSRVAKHDQNEALAADLLERSLFTFGRVTLSAFRKNLEDGKARLSFRRPENREFWLAGFTYMKTLIPKGTYRTALEWAKLLFSLSPDDPYALMHYMHVLAIKAFEAQWLVDFFATDVFRLCPDAAEPYVRQTLVLARLQLKDAAGARDLLVRGMAELPWLYGALLKSLNLEVPRALWAVVPRGDDERFHTDLYLHMAGDMWDTGAATGLLKEVASSHFDKQPPDAKRNASLPPAPPITRAVARLVYLDGAQALLALVPRPLLAAFPNFDFDPLPPPKEDNVFSSPVQELPWQRPEDKLDAIRAFLRARGVGVDVAADDRLQALLAARGVAGGAAGPAPAGGPMPGGFDDDDEDDESETGEEALRRHYADMEEEERQEDEGQDEDEEEREDRRQSGGAGGGVLGWFAGLARWRPAQVEDAPEDEDGDSDEAAGTAHAQGRR